MRLITEEVTDVKTLITEGADGKRNYKIKGIFMQAETKNKNGRIYPRPILEREVQRYNNNYVAQNRAFGELGHPDSPSINLDKVSHMITSLRAEGNNFVGEAKILDTPNGEIVKRLLDAGANLGVSTRGVGSLKESNGVKMVCDDFHLATAADIVADPSAPEAFVQGIMENREWILEHGSWKEVDYDQAKKSLQEASRYDWEARMLAVFNDYMSKL